MLSGIDGRRPSAEVMTHGVDWFDDRLTAMLAAMLLRIEDDVHQPFSPLCCHRAKQSH
jgi:hypothetical protein